MQKYHQQLLKVQSSFARQLGDSFLRTFRAQWSFIAPSKAKVIGEAALDPGKYTMAKVIGEAALDPRKYTKAKENHSTIGPPVINIYC